MKISENELKNYTGKRPVEVHDIINSTNIRAKELAMLGAESGTLIMAKNQRGGHGKFGRPFYCEEGGGLYMSLILRPHIKAEDSLKLTAFAAVCTARAIEKQVKCDVKIKWVNDLYLNGRKICGILTEGAVLPDGYLNYAVVGIGVNTGKIDFPHELKSIATSVYNETGEIIDQSRLALDIADAMDRADDLLMDEYGSRSCVTGKKVHAIVGNKEFDARIIDIDKNGFLIAEYMGDIVTIKSGEVIMNEGK